MNHHAERAFNSATAVMPWKTRLEVVHRCRLIRRAFNSATAVMPWKPLISWDERFGRPLSFNSATAVMPWKTLGSALPQALITLQFGHGGDAVENGGVVSCDPAVPGTFNSATAVMPWKIP